LKIQFAVSRIIWTKGRYACSSRTLWSRQTSAQVNQPRERERERERGGTEREREREREEDITKPTKLHFKFMMKTDPRVKMLNLIRVSIKMNNNEHTRVSEFSSAIYLVL